MIVPLFVGMLHAPICYTTLQIYIYLADRLLDAVGKIYQYQQSLDVFDLPVIHITAVLLYVGTYVCAF